MLKVCLQSFHLKRTLSVAVVVGTILFMINQFDVVLTGQATLLTWVRAGLTYVIPFGVANYGIIIASRRVTSKPDAGA